MEELTVQMAAASTEAAVTDADCGTAVQTADSLSQDTVSSEIGQEVSPSTDSDADALLTETDRGEMPDAAYLPVYKGKVYPMRASDTQEITTLLQLGMKQREWQPLLEDLQMLAEKDGARSVREWIGRSVEEYDRQTLEAAVELFGEKEGRRQFEWMREQSRRRLSDQATDDRQEMQERLATEFVELRREFPDYTSVTQLPDEVLETALVQGVPLMDALLRFQHRENRRSKAHRQVAAAATASGVGSLRQTAADGRSSAMDAFLKGLHQRL